MEKNKETRSMQNDYLIYEQVKMCDFNQADKVETNNVRALSCLASAVLPWRPEGSEFTPQNSWWTIERSPVLKLDFDSLGNHSGKKHRVNLYVQSAKFNMNKSEH